VWNEITEVTGMYCTFVSGALAALLEDSMTEGKNEVVTIPDAPETDEAPLCFFVHGDFSGE
jgi:hypothetical protein